MRRAEVRWWFFILLIFSARYYDAQPPVEWVRAEGGVSNEGIKQLACDNAGNVYVVGEFDNNTIINGQSLNLSNGNNFLAKYNAQGVYQWMLQLRNFSLMDMKANEEYVYLAGGFTDTLIAGGVNLISKGNSDAIVIRVDKNGNTNLALSGSGTEDEIVNGVDIDDSGNIYATGMYSKVSVFNNDTLKGGNNYSYFLIKYDNNGNIVWKSTGSQHDQYVFGRNISVSHNGSLIYILGMVQGLNGLPDKDSVDFSNSNMYYQSYSNYDYLLMAYHGNGELYKLKGFNAGNHYVSVAIGQDSSGCLYYAGYGDNTGYGLTKYGMQLNLIWMSSVRFSYQSWLADMKVNDKGEIYTTGSFDDYITFSNDTLHTYGHTSFMAKYDADGSYLWAYKTGSHDDSGLNLANNKNGDLFLAGLFTDTLKMASQTFITSGGDDIYIGKFSESMFSGLSYHQFPQNSLKLYPNPTSGDCNIDCSAGNSTLTRLKVRNSLGQQVYYKERINTSKPSVDLSGQPKGVYFIEYYSEGELLSGTIILH